jgi:hypothetical protein
MPRIDSHQRLCSRVRAANDCLTQPHGVTCGELAPREVPPHAAGRGTDRSTDAHFADAHIHPGSPAIPSYVPRPSDIAAMSLGIHRSRPSIPLEVMAGDDV